MRSDGRRCRTIVSIRADPGAQGDACAIPRGFSFFYQVAARFVRKLGSNWCRYRLEELRLCAPLRSLELHFATAFVNHTYQVAEEHEVPVVQQHTVVQQPVYQQQAPVYNETFDDDEELIQKPVGGHWQETVEQQQQPGEEDDVVQQDQQPHFMCFAFLAAPSGTAQLRSAGSARTAHCELHQPHGIFGALVVIPT